MVVVVVGGLWLWRCGRWLRLWWWFRARPIWVEGVEWDSEEEGERGT